MRENDLQREETLAIVMPALNEEAAVGWQVRALWIRHRPVPPRTPHLNGKVERARKK